jgi:hypothetical protein
LIGAEKEEAHGSASAWKAYREATISTLAIIDGVAKHVAKLFKRAQVTGTDKVDHAPIFLEVVLER